MMGGLAALMVFGVIFLVWSHFDKEKEIREQRSEILYIKDGYDTSIIISIKDTRRKVNAFTTQVMAQYGKRYHRKKLRAMSPNEKALFNRLNIKFAEILNYGYYDLIAIALLESEFNPYAKGKLQNEASIFQLAPSAVADAALYYRQLPPELKKMFSFKYHNHSKDLEDSINALKIAAVLYWGLRKDFKRQQDWVLTFYHWGKTRIYKYFKLNQFPHIFIFNANTEREDRRSVINYFNTWYKITSAFNRGRIEVEKRTELLAGH